MSNQSRYEELQNQSVAIFYKHSNDIDNAFGNEQRRKAQKSTDYHCGVDLTDISVNVINYRAQNSLIWINNESTSTATTIIHNSRTQPGRKRGKSNPHMCEEMGNCCDLPLMAGRIFSVVAHSPTLSRVRCECLIVALFFFPSATIRESKQIFFRAKIFRPKMAKVDVVFFYSTSRVGFHAWKIVRLKIAIRIALTFHT